ncbi:MAG: NAD(+)/NADH kinase [Trueperaceae bacterium]|nr:NAD(+)/NADH kinase [Trueperaceae bacterium]
MVVTASRHKPDAVPLARRYADRLRELGADVDLEVDGSASLAERARHADLVVSVGGDGTLLDVARRLVGADVPVLGVNLGKLGFLAGFSPEEFEAYLDGASPHAWRVDEEMMLQARVNGGQPHVALNDVAVSQGVMTRLLEIDMWVAGEHAIAYRADGLVVSTPVGSTAYSLSLGGPILGRGLRAFVITPIAPHSLTNRPIVVGADVSIEFVVHGRIDELALLADGQERIDLGEGDRVEIDAASGTVLLVSSGRLGPYGVMREKLGWGLGPAMSRNAGAPAGAKKVSETETSADETV